jgi:hypothetical protein
VWCLLHRWRWRLGGLLLRYLRLPLWCWLRYRLRVLLLVTLFWLKRVDGLHGRRSEEGWARRTSIDGLHWLDLSVVRIRSQLPGNTMRRRLLLELALGMPLMRARTFGLLYRLAGDGVRSLRARAVGLLYSFARDRQRGQLFPEIVLCLWRVSYRARSGMDSLLTRTGWWTDMWLVHGPHITRAFHRL